ncbi:Mobile element protein [Candidatus Enterovibrio altilux]|uniref:Mobile element protein n=1 Tax=Candidatus Enterovibrio altilux TaxID=1927128 RepID=A0A291BB47_9GAMM|nr:Mobile element protein [Candidatus Enterovibrio luxaltus]
MSLSCPHYLRISKRVKIVNVTFKTKNKRIIQHLTVDSAVSLA